MSALSCTLLFTFSYFCPNVSALTITLTFQMIIVMRLEKNAAIVCFKNKEFHCSSTHGPTLGLSHHHTDKKKNGKKGLEVGLQVKIMKKIALQPNRLEKWAFGR